MKLSILSLLFVVLGFSVSAQYVEGTNVKYGNEWINFSNSYFKITVDEDGIYRISKAELENAGFPVNSVPMSEFSLYRNGNEEYVFTSTDGLMGNSDYVEFYGVRNRNEIDKYAFSDQNDQLNPEFSLITDVSSYFLSYDVGQNLRYSTVETDLSSNLPPVEQYYMHEEMKVFAAVNGFTKASASAVRYSSARMGEGFGDGLKPANSNIFSLSEIFDNGPTPTIKLRYFTNTPQHVIQVKIGSALVESYSFSGNQLIDDEFDFASNLLSNSMTVSVNGTDSSNDKLNLSKLSVTYPRAFKFNGDNEASFKFESSFFDRYFEIEDFDLSSGNPILYDLGSRRRITSVVENGITKIVAPDALIESDFRLFSVSAVKTALQIEQVEFIDYSAMNHDYLILTGAELMNGPGPGDNYIQEYADYRASSIGGGFNPKIVEAQQIYDQFGYGINNHFLGVKAFLSYLNTQWTDLEYVFIIGKAREYAFYRFESQQASDPDFHIPSFGYPASDNLLASKWGETAPQVAIGRLAARTPQQVKQYFDKVVSHENQINNPQTVEDKLWMKKVLHLSGGDPTIKELLKSYLNNMGNIIENNSYGADVTTYFKTSSDPVELPQSQEILELINDGLSMITFFGHSAVGVFDLNLEDVEDYSNENKYPLMISLGCHSGNIHTASQNGLSEKFVLADKKGAIAFLAASSQAYISQQYEFGKDFYEQAGTGMYYESIGKIAKRVNEMSDGFSNSGWETLLEQLTLHGDPAVRLHAAPGEDYTPEFSSVTLNPQVVSAFQEDFEMCFDIANLGVSAPKPMKVNIQHTSPLGAILVDTIITVTSPKYRENYCVTLPITNQAIVGKNTIKVFVDNDFAIEELPNPAGENNNQLLNTAGGVTFDFFILNNGAVPVMPKNYSIYNQQDVELSASTYNALGNAQNYIFQLDTTDKFNSPLLTSEVIEDVASFITWSPDFSFKPNVVYYWRVSPEANSSGPGLIWNEASFLYLPNATLGWNQSHVDQWNDNELENLVLEPNGNLQFGADFREIRVLNKVSANGDDANFFYSGSFYGFSYLRDWGPYIAVTPLDSLGNWYYHYEGDTEGAVIPGPEDFSFTYYFNPNTQQGRIDLIDFLENRVEYGHYVYLYTIMPKNNFNPNFSTSEWAADSLVNDNKNIFNVLEAQGAGRISEFRDEDIVPYNFFYRKDIGQLAEGKADDINGTADNSASVFGRWYTGTETTDLIGPSTKWSKLVWKDELSEFPEWDSSYVNIIGVTEDGVETVLRERLIEKEINLAQIDANEYPYLKLQYFAFDDYWRSSPSLTFWRVFYDGVAELALDFLSQDGIFNADTLDQGDVFLLQLPLKNIGLEDVDSINVRLTVTDQDNNAVIELQKTEPIESGEYSVITLEIPTDDLSGEYSVSVEANYDQTPTECFYFNNIALRNFIIRKDLRNPLLDVSFDGRRIINGDIVSAEPVIRIVTKDENKYLLMTDTSNYQLAIIDPVGMETTIPLSDPSIIFTPATSVDNNQSEIIYTPNFDLDGDYTLQVVSRDASGNLSGNKAFSVDFKIINEELISNVFNYPNPFSDCTQFVFTLTGNEVPAEMGIRIMTVSGKVVREIRGIELGPLHIGVNRTEYKWDGTDEFGSKLANGVYLYQIIGKKNDGENYEKYDTGTSQFFKNNIGKMVIIR